MANKFLRDITGSVLVEYTIVFPIFIVLILGTVDVSYMLYEWALANKAAYVGARKAVVSNPIASNIIQPDYIYTPAQLLQLGQSCFDPATGATNTTNCPSSLISVCNAPTSNNDCTNGGGWDPAAFTTILNAMKQVFPRLAPENVQISYRTNGLGFVDRPGGLPMNVTVSIQCMTHQFFFIDALIRLLNPLANWIFLTPVGCSPPPPSGPTIPAFASTLQSEDMVTN